MHSTRSKILTSTSEYWFVQSPPTKFTIKRRKFTSAKDGLIVRHINMLPAWAQLINEPTVLSIFTDEIDLEGLNISPKGTQLLREESWYLNLAVPACKVLLAYSVGYSVLLTFIMVHFHCSTLIFSKVYWITIECPILNVINSTVGSSSTVWPDDIKIPKLCWYFK